MFFVLLVSVLFRRPLTFIAVGGVGGRGGIKMASAKTQSDQLMSPLRPHSSPHSIAKTNDRSTNLRKNGVYIGISDVVTASLYSEKTRMKKLLMMMMKR